MKEKALLLDCGGVMVYPRTGDWAISPEMLRVLGDDFLHTKLERFREAKRTCAELIPDGHRLEDETAEAAMLECFYRRALSQMGETLTDAQYAFLVQCQLRHDRYGYFDDVLPHLRRWRGAVKLAIVSDAPPSTRRILRDAGISACVDVQTFSFQLGTLKPDARMYLRALEQLRIPPQTPSLSTISQAICAARRPSASAPFKCAAPCLLSSAPIPLGKVKSHTILRSLAACWACRKRKKSPAVPAGN